MFGIISRVEKKLADLEKTVSTMNREHEDSGSDDDDDRANEPTVEWSYQDSDDDAEDYVGGSAVQQQEASVGSIDFAESDELLEEEQEQEEEEEEEEVDADAAAMEALAPLLERAGLPHLLKSLVARGYRTPEQLAAAAARGPGALEQLGLKKAQGLKLRRALHEDAVTAEEAEAQAAAAEEASANACSPTKVGTGSDSGASSLSSSSSEEEDEEEDAEAAAEDAARRAEWQRTLAAEWATDPEVIKPRGNGMRASLVRRPLCSLPLLTRAAPRLFRCGRRSGRSTSTARAKKPRQRGGHSRRSPEPEETPKHARSER
jgi:hypothetical protein